MAAPEAGAYARTAFAARATDPTGAVRADDERCAIGASLALHTFHDAVSGFDALAFEQAMRTLTRALDAAHGAHSASPRRPTFIRLEGVAALMMRLGFAYDSDEARTAAAAIAALAHAAAISEVAALAETKGAFPDWAQAKRDEEANVKNAREAAQRLGGAIAARAQGLYRALPGAKNNGHRASITIAFAEDEASARRLGLSNAGLAPLPGVTTLGPRRDGGFGRLLTEDARLGLAALGYDEAAIAALALHVEGRRTLRDAPGVSLQRLAELGLTEPALEAIEDALNDAFSLRAAIHPLVIGAALCEQALKLPPDVAAGKRGDLLRTLGFAEAEIAAAEAYALGATSFADAPGLEPEHADIFLSEREIAPTARIAMARALAPFANCALSITLTEAHPERRATLMAEAHEAGVTLLNVRAETPPAVFAAPSLEHEPEEDEEVGAAPANTQAQPAPPPVARRRLPDRRKGYIQKSVVVTGVQTCALPICHRRAQSLFAHRRI